jgi:hypothetical protein
VRDKIIELIRQAEQTIEYIRGTNPSLSPRSGAQVCRLQYHIEAYRIILRLMEKLNQEAR